MSSEGLVPIKATVASVFYRKPNPEAEAYVEVGSRVTPESVICLLEVMKCFRSITAGVSGTIEKIFIESGDVVENGTELFLIKPD